MGSIRKNGVLVLACLCLVTTVYFLYVSEPYEAQVVYTSEAPSSDDGVDGSNPKKVKVTCQFPDFDPFNPEAMKHYQRYPTSSCPHGMPTITRYNGEMIRINQTHKNKTLGGQRVQCWYRTVSYQRRVNYVNGVWRGPFLDAIHITGQPEFVEVKCQNDQGKQVSRMHHYIVREEERKKATRPKHTEFGDNRMNVILLGIDSMASHLFKRAMPKTRDYLLHKMEAVEMKKYNRVGGNTFVNLLALTSGVYSEDIKDWTQAEGFDKVRFLWNRYKVLGYRTQYMSDRFDFDDFSHPPTDSYNLPMVQALMKDKISFNNNCFEDQIEVKLWLDSVLEFARESLFKTGRFFSLGFIDRPTHDFPNEASAVDEHYFNFFKEIHETGVLNNTFLVFFGDHGPRITAYRRTFYGSIEERAANVVLYLPPWFRTKYPQFYKNLKINAFRLTTNFDVHRTIENLVVFPSLTDKNIKPFISPTGKERGLNLFTEIPADRTCEDASLKPHSCMCHGGVVVSDDVIRQEVGLHVVRDINNILRPKSDLCARLKLKSVTGMVVLKGGVGRTAVYRVMLSTHPGDAAFEATVKYTVTLYLFTKIETLGLVSRLNVYRGQSDCVQEDKVSRMYCYCKDKLG